MRQHGVAGKRFLLCHLPVFDQDGGFRRVRVLADDTSKGCQKVARARRRHCKRDAPQQPPRLGRQPRPDFDLVHPVLRHALVPGHQEKHGLVQSVLRQHVRRENVDDLEARRLVGRSLVGVVKVGMEEKSFGVRDRRAGRQHA